MAERELTFGEQQVGLTFNPGGSPRVNEIKVAFAAEIDRLDDIRKDATEAGRVNQARWASIAITELQTAQMWAVKAATADS